MTAMFGIPRQEIITAVKPLLSGIESRKTEGLQFILIAFARAVWSRLAEPGDSLAGWMCASLGPVLALQAVVENASVDRVLAMAVAQSEHPGVEESDSQFSSSRLRDALSKSLPNWRARLNSKLTISDLMTAQRLEVSLIFPECDRWPTGLNDLGRHAPLGLWIRGLHSVLNTKRLAVVGARASSSYGEQVTSELVQGISRYGVATVSGGAYGIDAVAHRTALSEGSQTIAVLAGGIDRIYPSGNERLFRAITQSGMLCSEVAPGAAPTKWRFLQRNRLIAALAEATVVCEAGQRSGSLNTAGHAATLGRPLGAIPGPVFSASSAGCHRLLREYDAVCIRNAADALELMPGGLTQSQSAAERSQASGESAALRRVLDALPLRAARAVDVIAVSAGMSLEDVEDALAELELLGAVIHAAAGWKRATDRARSE